MASSSSVSLPAIPNFAGENYDYWSVKMKLFLKSCDLWEIVEKGYEAKVEGSEYSAAQLQQLKNDEMKDARALSYIHSAVSDRITPKIIRASSAKKAWNILLKEFYGSEKVRSVRLNKLRRDYANIKMRDDENIKEYSSRFMELVNQMQIYGESTSEKTIVPKVLATLNSKFNSIASMIEKFKDLSTLGITELFDSLLAHEEKFIKSDESPTEGAFQTNHKSRLPYLKEGKNKHMEGNNSRLRKFPPCGICGKTNHLEQKCWFKGKPKLQCRFCKKFGHAYREKLQKQGRTKFTDQFTHQAIEDHLFQVCQSEKYGNKQKWLIDNCCTSHMAHTSGKNPNSGG